MTRTTLPLVVALCVACDRGPAIEDPRPADAVDATHSDAGADAEPEGDAQEVDAGVADVGAAPDDDGVAVDGSPPDAAPERPELVACETEASPDGPREEWRHGFNAFVAASGEGHSAQDVVAVTGATARLLGKFTYGAISKDLEDEDVEVFLADCEGGWRSVGRRRTDRDGRLVLGIPAARLPAVGRYDVAFRVLGDGTVVRSRLWIVPPGTHLMVFDIDGTLTTDDLELFADLVAELFEPLLDGDHVPEARAGGVELTHLRRGEQHRLLVYLTGRPYTLTDLTRGWLAELGFAPGALHVVDDVLQVLPTNDAVGAYKRDYLLSLQERGLVIDAAYGNASTDLFAYAEAGIPAQRTFIAGPHGGELGTVAVGEDWRAHLDAAREEALPPQPFTDP